MIVLTVTASPRNSLSLCNGGVKSDNPKTQIVLFHCKLYNHRPCKMAYVQVNDGNTYQYQLRRNRQPKRPLQMQENYTQHSFQLTVRLVSKLLNHSIFHKRQYFPTSLWHSQIQSLLQPIFGTVNPNFHSSPASCRNCL